MKFRRTFLESLVLASKPAFSVVFFGLFFFCVCVFCLKSVDNETSVYRLKFKLQVSYLSYFKNNT